MAQKILIPDNPDQIRVQDGHVRSGILYIAWMFFPTFVALADVFVFWLKSKCRPYSPAPKWSVQIKSALKSLPIARQFTAWTYAFQIWKENQTIKEKLDLIKVIYWMIVR